MAYDRTVFLPIDPDAAFDLVTQPERLRRWKTVAARVDLRLGGEYRWTITPGNIAMGNFTKIEPGKCVSYTFGWTDDPNLQPGASKVTVTLEPVPGGTNVRLVHEGLTAEQEVGHAEGWDHFLERLVQYVTSGKATADPWNASPENLDALKSADASLAIAELILHEVKNDQLKNSTPCSDFNLQQLIDHQYGSMVNIAKSLGIPVSTDPDASFEVRLADLAQKVMETFTTRGLDGSLVLGENELPASVVANILNIELLIHAIDIAMASGQKYEVSPELADYVLGLTRHTISPEGRAAGLFGPEVPVADTAENVQHLLAFTGRAS